MIDDRAIRGGAWNLTTWYCCPDYDYDYSMDYRNFNFGFRPLRRRK